MSLLDFATVSSNEFTGAALSLHRPGVPLQLIIAPKFDRADLQAEIALQTAL